jgi:DNA-binding beta-propeller fold protein YncE
MEARALLSTVSARAADISAARHAPFGRPIVTQLPTAPKIDVSTVPANGDVNPYGVVFVPPGFRAGGPLRPGDILVSNFNAQSNLQGTGTTIVRVTPSGTQSLFFQGQTGLGLTTALGILKSGFIIVGNMPTTDGTSNTVQPGSLIVIDRFGNQVANLSDPRFVNGPWDMAVNDRGTRPQIFVSNVLNGTVVRFDLRETNHGRGLALVSATQIASGYTHRSDPEALELGPTGLAFNASRNVLYVASTADNAIYAIPNAGTTRRDRGTGRIIFSDPTHLHGPLGLVLAPNGDLLAANGDAVNPDPTQPSEIVEFNPHGRFIGQFSLDPTTEGAPFGIAVQRFGRRVGFAAVNDLNNTVEAWLVRR